MKLDVKSPTGTGAGTVDVPDELFGIEPNTAVMHQVVTAQLAAARAGTHSTKTRAEVAGGGAKPWRQKGTGRARQGSIRAPHWRGGGVAHGPKPRDYRQRTPKKMIRLALRSALSDRAAEGKVLVVDGWGIDEPRTKAAIELLGAVGLRTAGERDERILIVLQRDEAAVWKSFRNLGERVQLVIPDELNTYDVLVNDWLVFSKATLEAAVARFGSDRASDPDGTPAAIATESERDDEQAGDDQ
ncbi:MAG TPA: 50S ribosomal protein L4 [Acidimicrobiia bacterium]|jgi:large subunit ribosomal protein L4|nr:50S ribosomal protein L4 [Acidimicrobiia bacterium]